MNILIINALNGTLAQEARKKYPDASITCLEWVDHCIPWLKRQGFKTLCLNKNLKNWERELGDMKFDLVMGNPPYLKKGWKKFLEKMSQISSDYTYIICPDPTQTEGDFGNSVCDLLIKAGVYEQQECTDFFPEISTGKISYFLCSKNNKDTFVFEKDEVYLSIRNKVVPNGAFAIRGFYNPKGLEVSNSVSDEFSKPILFSVSKNGLEVKFVKADSCVSKRHNKELCGPFFVFNRFFGKDIDDPVFLVDDMQIYVASSNIIILKANEGETITGFKSVYLSNLYKFFLQKMKGKNFDVQRRYFVSLTRLDLTRTWIDEELYAYFGITQEEIEYIENNIM